MAQTPGQAGGTVEASFQDLDVRHVEGDLEPIFLSPYILTIVFHENDSGCLSVS